MPRFSLVANWLIVCLALGLASASAQTVLPVTPQTQALDRCHKLVVTRWAEAEAAAREVLVASGTTPDQRLAATACLAVAQILSGQREAGSTSVDEAKALLAAPGLTAQGRLDGQLRLPASLLRLGRVDEALAMQEQVLLAARELGIVPVQIESLRFMAQVRATEFDDPEGALPYFRQAYALHRAMVGASGNVNPPLSYDLGYTLLLLGKHDEADALFVEAGDAAASIPELTGMEDRIASHRAEILRVRGDAGAAEPRLLQALDRQRAGGDLPGEVTTLYRLARARLDLGRAQDALAPARESLAVAERLGDSGETRQALETLADVHTALGQHDVAAGYAKREREMGRTLEREATARRLARMQAQAADSDFTPAAAVSRADEARGALLRNVAIVALAVLALSATLLLLRARRRQRRLEAASVIDPLTRLPVRREASRRIEALEAEAATRAALLLIVIDRFGTINDRFGRAVGDRVLVAVADCLRQSCDPGDMVARWGGSEFVVLRGDTEREAAFALAAHLRAQLERLQVEDDAGAPLSLSLSIGVSSLPLFPGPSHGRQDALRAADRAVRVAGRLGGNAWVGLWGVVPGIEAVHALGDIPSALANGWFDTGSNARVDLSKEWAAADGVNGHSSRDTDDDPLAAV